MIQSSEIRMSPSYETILRNVASLSREEQLQLMSDLAAYLRAHEWPDSGTSILELQGLGKDIWRGIDAQDYVHRERASWNG
jgi:hypothetical protein